MALVSQQLKDAYLLFLKVCKEEGYTVEEGVRYCHREIFHQQDLNFRKKAITFVNYYIDRCPVDFNFGKSFDSVRVKRICIESLCILHETQYYSFHKFYNEYRDRSQDVNGLVKNPPDIFRSFSVLYDTYQYIKNGNERIFKKWFYSSGVEVMMSHAKEMVTIIEENKMDFMKFDE